VGHVLDGSAPATTVWITPLLGHPEVRAALDELHVFLERTL